MVEKFAKEGARLVKLRAKLKSCEGVAGYEETCKAIRAEIAALESKSSFLGNSTSSPSDDNRLAAGWSDGEAPSGDNRPADGSGGLDQ